VLVTFFLSFFRQVASSVFLLTSLMLPSSQDLEKLCPAIVGGRGVGLAMATTVLVLVLVMVMVTAEVKAARAMNAVIRMVMECIVNLVPEDVCRKLEFSGLGWGCWGGI
jgi:hypothetical protein